MDLRRLAPKPGKIEIGLQAPPALLEVDEIRFRQCIANWISYVVEFVQEEQAVVRLLAGRPALRDTVPEPELRRLMRRQIGIFKYVEFRFRPQLRVGDDEVRKAWEEEQAGRPAGPAFEEVQDELRSRLERRALDERIEAWVKELRARSDVRYVPPPPPPGGP